MSAVSIVPEANERQGRVTYRASARNGSRETAATGESPGEALDRILIELDDADSATVVIVQKMTPDRYFGAEQIDRLRNLVDRANGSGEPLSSNEQSELENLIEAELMASAQRAAALADSLGR